MTRTEIRAVLERYVAGERPEAIAAALELDVDTVRRMCNGPTSAGEVARAVTVRPKRAGKAKAAPAGAPAPAAPAAETFNPADWYAKRNGGTAQRNYGYGYAAIVGGGRRL